MFVSSKLLISGRPGFGVAQHFFKHLPTEDVNYIVTYCYVLSSSWTLNTCPTICMGESLKFPKS